MGENIKLLRKRWARISRLEQTIAVLQWDMETYMPEEGVLARSEQLALLSELHHQWLVAEETGRLINNSEKEAEGDYFSDDVSLVRAQQREHMRRAQRFPRNLCRALHALLQKQIPFGSSPGRSQTLILLLIFYRRS